MEILSEQNADTLLVTLKGRLDTTTSPELSDFLTPRLPSLKALVLNLKEVDYVSSAGLRIVLTIRKALPAPDAFKITGVCESVMEVFEMTGFADILTIEQE